jgi:hypothetical protein
MSAAAGILYSKITDITRGFVVNGWSRVVTVDGFSLLQITFNNEELHGLYSSPSIVRVIKARRMR